MRARRIFSNIMRIYARDYRVGACYFDNMRVLLVMALVCIAIAASVVLSFRVLLADAEPGLIGWLTQ